MAEKVDDMVIRNLVNGIGVLSVVVSIGVFAALIKWPLISVLVFAGAFIIYAVSSSIQPQTKIGKVILMIISIPSYILLGLIYLSGPALGIFSALFGASILNAILTIIIGGIYWLVAEKPSPEIVIFLFVCLETIFLSNHTDRMKKWLHKVGLWRAWKHDAPKQKLIKIGDYFFQTENMHFIISFAYVLFLFLMAFLNISNRGHVFSEGIDNAIWKAFLVYIAYTTMMTRYQKTEATTADTAREIYDMFLKGRIDVVEEKMDRAKESCERMSAHDADVNNKEMPDNISAKKRNIDNRKEICDKR